MISDSVLSFYVQHSYRLFFVRLIQSVNYCNNRNQTKMLVTKHRKIPSNPSQTVADTNQHTGLVRRNRVALRTRCSCTKHLLNMFYLGKPPENMQSYFGLIDGRMDQSEKEQPVLFFDLHISNILLNIATVDGKVLLKQLLYSSNSDPKLRTSIVNYWEK